MRPEVRDSVAELELTVSSAMTAVLDGVEIHPVYSTFWLAHHAETVARKAIEPFFDEGENAVGGEVCVRHEAMTAVGSSVKIRAKVSEINGKKIVCAIEAFSGNRRIASGHQTQIVLPATQIRALVERAYQEKT